MMADMESMIRFFKLKPAVVNNSQASHSHINIKTEIPIKTTGFM